MTNTTHSLTSQLDSLSRSPGCYLYKNSSGEIIYVGKAKDLKKRVSSYFQKKDHDEKTKALVSHIDSFACFVTDTEVEALILENNLIKKHMPKYNITLKDSKRYAYILLTDEVFPRFVIARDMTAKGKYFGPFTSAAVRDYVLSTLIKAFKIRTCRKLPKRACLRYHLGICSAPCIQKIADPEYMKNVAAAEMVLKGKENEIVPSLESEMKKASAAKDYERALEYKNQIRAIGWLSERQKMERQKKYDEDVVNYIVKDGKVFLMLFHVYKGVLAEKEEFEFPAQEDFFEKFLSQYYDEHAIPKEVIVPQHIPVIDEFLGLKRKGSGLFVPQKGEKKQLLELVKKNIEATFFAEEEKLEELMKALKLQDVPRVIECFDISHLSGTSTVASMVQFRNGKPDKSNYRRFKIQTVVEQEIDDFRSIQEVVFRRYRRLVEEKAELPSLIVIDGGKGQLSSAIASLRELGIKLPIISLAKKLEEVFVPGSIHPIPVDGKALKLLQSIRDEAHRFAISYNRLLRSKKIREEFE